VRVYLLRGDIKSAPGLFYAIAGMTKTRKRTEDMVTSQIISAVKTHAKFDSLPLIALSLCSLCALFVLSLCSLCALFALPYFSTLILTPHTCGVGPGLNSTCAFGLSCGKRSLFCSFEFGGTAPQVTFLSFFHDGVRPMSFSPTTYQNQ